MFDFTLRGAELDDEIVRALIARRDGGGAPDFTSHESEVELHDTMVNLGVVYSPVAVVADGTDDVIALLAACCGRYMLATLTADQRWEFWDLSTF